MEKSTESGTQVYFAKATPAAIQAANAPASTSTATDAAFPDDDNYLGKYLLPGLCFWT